MPDAQNPNIPSPDDIPDPPFPDIPGIESSLHFRTEDPPDEPVLFNVDGETFTAVSWLPGPSFLKYSRLMSQGGVVSTGAIEDFFNEILPKDEAERFWKYVSDPAHRITAGILGEMFLSLFARYASGPEERSRPTKPSARSSRGRDKTSGGSKGN